jgi:SAM-dependent methyltransferase
MRPSEIAESYDAIADRWLKPSLEPNGIRQHEHALRFRAGAVAGDGVNGVALDVGSGARERNPEVTFHHVDVCEWSPPRLFDFITAWDSIWHVPLAQHEALLRKLCGALAPGGVFIWTTGGLDGPTEKGDSAMGPPVWYSVLGISETLRTIADAGCVCRHLEYDQLPELHVFLIVQKA